MDLEKLVRHFNAMLKLDFEVILKEPYLVLHDTLVDHYIEEIFIVVNDSRSSFALIHFNRTPECPPPLKLQRYLDHPEHLDWTEFKILENT